MKRCNHCGKELTRRYNETPSAFKKRKYCSLECVRKHGDFPKGNRCVCCGKRMRKRFTKTTIETTESFWKRKVCSSQCLREARKRHMNGDHRFPESFFDSNPLPAPVWELKRTCEGFDALLESARQDKPEPKPEPKPKQETMIGLDELIDKAEDRPATPIDESPSDEEKIPENNELAIIGLAYILQQMHTQEKETFFQMIKRKLVSFFC